MKEEEENYLKNIKRGLKVEILTKSKKKATGLVEDLGSSRIEYHPEGIMVVLKTGEVGRVKKIVSDKKQSEIEPILKKGESYKSEFKSEALWSLNLKEQEIKESKSLDLHTYRHKASKVIIARSIAAFLNSEGGDLFIGIKEKKGGKKEYDVTGINPDIEKLKANNKDSSLDGYKRMLIDDIIRPYFPSKIYNFLNNYLTIDFNSYNNKEVCIIKIKPSDTRVFLNLEGRKVFMIRTETESRVLQDEELVDYCMKRFSR